MLRDIELMLSLPNFDTKSENSTSNIKDLLPEVGDGDKQFHVDMRYVSNFTKYISHLFAYSNGNCNRTKIYN